MADQCIVCLDVLDVDDPSPSNGDIVESEVIVKNGLEELAAATAHNNSVDTQQLLAVIQTCGHILHDSCLKEWIQKANSCPICRQQFNLVEVHDRTTGKPITLVHIPAKLLQSTLLTLS
jgi:4-hydroxy-3-methylbut-2-en-1-yl diphosphate synthase IspG/GcpE